MTGVIVPVHVEDWQLECCGEHVQIGSSVAWHLEDADEVHVVTTVRQLVPAWSVVLPVLEVVKQLPDGSETVVAGGSGPFVEGWRGGSVLRVGTGLARLTAPADHRGGRVPRSPRSPRAVRPHRADLDAR
ncbi:DUF6578 domain-containing protein [Quadrisphaera oryzae]|uniref:DUF6578 domain-containing protein n=1 Tax=Quadrisphaera TaxID=317661 RepID=UPI00351C3BED